MVLTRLPNTNHGHSISYKEETQPRPPCMSFSISSKRPTSVNKAETKPLIIADLSSFPLDKPKRGEKMGKEKGREIDMTGKATQHNTTQPGITTLSSDSGKRSVATSNL